MRKLNTDEFIRKARLVHGDTYDYSDSIYEDARKPVAIRCKIHGTFFATPDNHINKRSGCPICAGNTKKYTTEQFVSEAYNIYGNKFLYDKAIYINNHTDVIITCPIHGDFSINPRWFLSGMSEPCPSCDLHRNVDTEKFILKAKNVHGELYNYDKTMYTGNRNSVIITCRVHGDFCQLPHEHLIGHGCPKCNNGVLINTDEFIRKARLVHGDTYDYSKSLYSNSITPIIITCRVHGDFYQRPVNHLSGRGCPNCNKSLLERDLESFMTLAGINYECQKSWDWLIYKNKQTVDFYIPYFNVAIECQGIQHFSEVPFFESEKDNLERRTLRDINKQRLCLEHGILIYYYSNLSKNGTNFNYPYVVYEDPNELFNEIINNNSGIIRL